MGSSPLTFNALAAYLDDRLEAHAYGQVRDRNGRGDPNGIYRPSHREVSHLTLALEPWSELERRLGEEQTDALFLHRPWQLTAGQQAVLEEKDVGVLAYHLSFDEHFTLGFSLPLAAALGLMPSPEVLGYKEGRPLGMLGMYAEPIKLEEVLELLDGRFGGLDFRGISNEKLSLPVKAVAVVGAMTDALIREAHEKGANLYVTGQLRQPAAGAVRDTGIVVAAVGHLRSEVWGLYTLAADLRARFEVGTAVVEPPMP